jgi:hypothetical protein
VVSTTVLLATATFSTTIVFSLIEALIEASEGGSSSGGSDSPIPITGILIMGILTIHITLTPTVVINRVVKISI